METTPLPKLILSANDVLRIPHSDIDAVNFGSDEKKVIAHRLHDLAILERRGEYEPRIWSHEVEELARILDEISSKTGEAKRAIYDALLTDHNYPKKPQLILGFSDVYANRNNFSDRKPFKSIRHECIANSIASIMRFEVELNNELTNVSRLDESERRAMVRDTGRHIVSSRADLIEALTANYEE